MFSYIENSLFLDSSLRLGSLSVVLVFSYVIIDDIGSIGSPFSVVLVFIL